MKRSHHPAFSSHENRKRRSQRLSRPGADKGRAAKSSRIRRLERFLRKETALSRIMHEEEARRRIAAPMASPGQMEFAESEISTVEARSRFSEVVNRATYGKERVILTRHGKKIAAVIPLEDLKLIEEMEDRIDIEEAEKAWAEQGDEPPASLEEVKKRLGLK
jgi:prevent-host-death family protein